MAMTLLPAFVVPMAWTILQYPPETADADLQARLWRFSAYVSSTWISGSFPVSLWTHFDNDGPRTTNIAEGWHNSLISQFGVSHPSMRVFLDWLQKCHSMLFIYVCTGTGRKVNKIIYTQSVITFM